MITELRTCAPALLAAALLCGASGCDLKPSSRDQPETTAATPAVEGLSESIASSKAVASMPTTFVRERPQTAPTGGVDACAYLGFSGLACLEALLAESDPIERRYMRRLSDAAARIALENLNKGQSEGVAHAELAMFCAEDGACKQKDPEGNELDAGYACLTKAELALQEGEEAAAKKAHARACRCDPKHAQIPVMGGVLACDGQDRPVKRGEDLALEVAQQIRACGECDHDTGPAACRQEVGRLEGSDPPLATYVSKVHAPRCAQP